MADYFAQLNNKMGGDLKKIQTVGEYMVEIWKAVGMEGIKDDNTGSVRFLSASEEINRFPCPPHPTPAVPPHHALHDFCEGLLTHLCQVLCSSACELGFDCALQMHEL